MDREPEDMQFLGLVDMYRDTIKIIMSWGKIFSKITMALILPLSFIYLVHMEVSHAIFSSILTNEDRLEFTSYGTARYEKLTDLISKEWTYLLLFKAAYFTVFLILSLLSTAAVVYTIASVYTSRDLSFATVMSVVPKVWKRLMATFLCIFAALFAYNLLFVLLVMTTVILMSIADAAISAAVAVLVVLMIFYFIGMVYLSIVWQLASVVSVLEESYGVQAMTKSRGLIRGKALVASVVFFKLNVALLAVQFLFQRFVVHGDEFGMGSRVAYAIICLVLLSTLILFGLVIQTVIYFVCKSYHHERIDKSALSDHLEVYLGEYVPLKAKDIQLEHFQV